MRLDIILVTKGAAGNINYFWDFVGKNPNKIILRRPYFLWATPPFFFSIRSVSWWSLFQYSAIAARTMSWEGRRCTAEHLAFQISACPASLNKCNEDCRSMEIALLCTMYFHILCSPRQSACCKYNPPRKLESQNHLGNANKLNL